MYDSGTNPSKQVIDGDVKEKPGDSDEDKAFMRRVAAESIVLLKNESRILPLNPKQIKKIAVGENQFCFRRR